MSRYTPADRPEPAGTVTEVEVAVVGAGFAGIAMALELRRAGIESFLLLERGDSVGGTWRDNHYPGVACDVPSHLYALKAHPNPHWSATFAPGAEIHRYLERVCATERLTDRIHLNTSMSRARWNGERWEITTDGRHRGTVLAAELVLACGRLTEPRLPAVSGLDSFPGPRFHSSRWDHRVEFAGTRVGLVGTGASAVQILPELIRAGARVTLFQRSPAWIVPREAHSYSQTEQAAFAADPSLLERTRRSLYREGEDRFASRSGDGPAAAAAEAMARAHLRTQVADADLRTALSPDYAFGCKRVLLSDDFYPAVAGPQVRLEPSALASVNGTDLHAASGRTHRADVLVLATGFASTRQPYAELVHGEHGRSLAEHWSAGMTAFASTVVSGFPNLFVLNGPNASLGHNSSVLMSEAQAAYVVRTLVRSPGVRRLRPDAERQWTAEIAEAAAGTPWLRGGCRNWYVDERSGRLVLLWPGTVDAFRSRLEAADGTEFDQVRRGRFSPTASAVS